MLPRYPMLSLSLAILAGCSTTNNYDPAQNPFDEPSITAPEAFKSHQPTKMAILPHDRAIEAADGPPGSYEAIAIPVTPDRQIEVVEGSASESPHVQEMMIEANRIGSLGDLVGKAELLSQAGYSGSSKAFYDLARMYLDGSLPSDMPQALKYVTLSHDAGYAEATRVLGMLYLRGQGVPADERYGRLLLEQASKSSVRAAREYGLLLLNRQPPHLNDANLGLEYLRKAAELGDADAAKALSIEIERIAGAERDEQVLAASSIDAPTQPSNTPAASLKQRALQGDAGAMYAYAQQVLLRKIPAQEPEFTAYCWLAVAETLGSKEASVELGFIRGVRSLSDTKSPGRLDQCINDLHYQVRGRN